MKRTVLTNGYYDLDCDVFIARDELWDWECPCHDTDNWYLAEKVIQTTMLWNDQKLPTRENEQYHLEKRMDHLLLLLSDEEREVLADKLKIKKGD
ncbi:hypothetical protein [Radiobacillus sp. PE A8.2]|uniref:hypothetical protein n=1 Tax=Radiobacillus sp. PE A8.2 TaxID=3380349 RepID=UPI00388E7D9E